MFSKNILSGIFMLLILIISCNDKVVTQDESLISITPSSLDFGSSQVEMYLYIENNGGGTLDWSINISELDWILVSPFNGIVSTDVDTVAVFVNREGLDGENIDTLHISSNGGTGEVEVIMTVPTTPTLAVSPTFLNYGNIQDELSFRIFNNGPGTLDWTISEDLEWLEITPLSGSTSSDVDTITVSISRPHSSSDTLMGDIIVSSNGGSELVEVLVIDDFNGIYVVLTADRLISSHQHGGPRNDILMARFDSVYAPCGPEIPLMVDSVYCNEYALYWNDELELYSYSQTMPRSFIELGASYEFNILGNSIVPSITSSIIFPEYEPVIIDPVDSDSISRIDDLDIVWEGIGAGTVYISLISEADSACVIPGDSSLVNGIFVSTENDGIYTIVSNRLSVLDPGQFILRMNHYNIYYISAEGLDSRSYIVGKTTSQLLLYIE